MECIKISTFPGEFASQYYQNIFCPLSGISLYSIGRPGPKMKPWGHLFLLKVISILHTSYLHFIEKIFHPSRFSVDESVGIHVDHIVLLKI